MPRGNLNGGFDVRRVMRHPRTASGLAWLLASAISLAGCSAGTPNDAAAAADPTDPCADPAALAEDPQFNPVDPCRTAVALADERLGFLHWPVSAKHVRRTMCPPNARCAPLVGNSWVIYWFWLGDPVMIHVGPQANGSLLEITVVADAPEPVPAWLLEELRAGGS